MGMRCWLAVAIVASRPSFAEEPEQPAREAERSRGEVQASLGGSFVRQDGFRGDAVSGGLSVGLNLGRPVVDDGEPLALQPYLQRPDSLTVSAGAGGTWTSRDYSSLATRSNSQSVTVAGGHWFSRVFLGGSLGLGRSYSFASLTNVAAESTVYGLAPGVDLGVRIGTTHLAIDYGVGVFFGDAAPNVPNWGALGLSVTWLLDTVAQFRLRGFNVAGDGVGASFFAEIFPTARVGVYASLNYEDLRRSSPSSPTYSSGGIAAGAGFWLTRRWELDVSVNLGGATSHSAGSRTLWNEGAGAALRYRFR